MPPFTAEQIQELLAAHNKYRAEVGTPPLQWSATLAQSAQAWADQLAARQAFEHSQSAGVGENIWQGTQGSFALTQMVDGWGAEKQYFTPGTFPNVSTTGDWSAVGHYTQIVWRGTSEVGCGLAKSGDNDVLVCQYRAAGNMNGENVY